MQTDKPLVVCFSGLDPTGGAGIQADIETLQALDCHALPIISSLTVQTTSNVLETRPSDPELIRRQFTALLESQLAIAAIKLGLIDSPEVMHCISEIIRKHPAIPVVADPVLKAGGGFEFGGEDLARLYRDLILPHCRVLTPNTLELQKLSPLSNSDDQAMQDLCSTGCKYILLTGTHKNGDKVINRLYSPNSSCSQSAPTTDLQWSWPRLPGEYHGSGCTLASAVAAGLAANMSVAAAAERAQQFTWHALKNALRTGNGQYLPDRRTQAVTRPEPR